MPTKRRAPRVVWLPPNTSGSINEGGTPGDETTWRQFAVTVSGPIGTVGVGEIPLVIDGADNQTSLADSIADLYASTYRLRRIVGKIYATTRLDVDPQVPGPRVLGVTAGIIVRRTDSITGTSLAGLTGNAVNFSPERIVNSNDPWVWRRNWLMTTPRAPGATLIVPTIISTNFIGQPGSVDGAHVDAKTARIVGPEERLFLDVGVTVIALDGAPLQGESTVDIFFDLRVLASLKTGSGNRRNASR